MRKPLVLAAVASLALLPFFLGSDAGAEPAETAPAASWIMDSPIADLLDVSPAFHVPNCRDIDGDSCSVEGARAKCEWQPGEPDVCVCQGGTFHCG